MSAKGVSLLDKIALTVIDTIQSYVDALREEPKLRFFFVWTLLGDTGAAVSAWAATAFSNDIVKTPEDHAAIAIPAVWATIFGNLVGGLLADWPKDPARLPAWRYKITALRHFLHLIWLWIFVVVLATGHGTLAFKVAYTTVTQVIQTVTGPTRTAYFVDLLRKEQLQRRANGTVALDVNGRPKEYKEHLLTGHALLHQTERLASFLGLAAGGWLLHAVAGQYWMLYGAHAVSYVFFFVGVTVTCHPTIDWRAFSLRQLFRDPTAPGVTADAHAASDAERRPFLVELAIATAIHAKECAVAVGRFAIARENYPLVALLALEWVVKLSNGMFNTRLLVTQVLGQDLEFMRRLELKKTLMTIVMTFLIVALRPRLRWLGWVVVVAVAVEGAARVAGGSIAYALHAGIVGGADARIALGFTVASLVAAGASAVVISALANFAHQSCSSSALRGQILAGIVIVDSFGTMASHALFPPLAAAFGQGELLAWAGAAQVVVVVVMLALPRRGPAAFGIRVAGDMDARAAA